MLGIIGGGTSWLMSVLLMSLDMMDGVPVLLDLYCCESGGLLQEDGIEVGMGIVQMGFTFEQKSRGLIDVTDGGGR